MIMEKFVYAARIVAAHDGDTITAVVDLGFEIIARKTFRLARINAPEVRGGEKVAGIASRDFLRDKILGEEVMIKTIKDSQEKYGRYLAEVYYSPEGPTNPPINLNDELVVRGLAIYKEY